MVECKKIKIYKSDLEALYLVREVIRETCVFLNSKDIKCKQCPYYGLCLPYDSNEKIIPFMRETFIDNDYDEIEVE